MGKKSGKASGGNDELNSILAQLKDSYGKEPENDIDDKDNTETGDADLQLSSMLSQFFKNSESENAQSDSADSADSDDSADPVDSVDMSDPVNTTDSVDASASVDTDDSVDAIDPTNADSDENRAPWEDAESDETSENTDDTDKVTPPGDDNSEIDSVFSRMFEKNADDMKNIGNDETVKYFMGGDNIEEIPKEVSENETVSDDEPPTVMTSEPDDNEEVSDSPAPDEKGKLSEGANITEIYIEDAFDKDTENDGAYRIVDPSLDEDESAENAGQNDVAENPVLNKSEEEYIREHTAQRHPEQPTELKSEAVGSETNTANTDNNTKETDTVDTKITENSADSTENNSTEKPHFNSSRIDSPISLTPEGYDDYLQVPLPVGKISKQLIQFEQNASRSKNVNDDETTLKTDIEEDMESDSEYRYNSTSSDRKIPPSRAGNIHGFCGKEYFSRNQTKTIIKKYASDKNDIIVRLAIFAVITLLLSAINIMNKTATSGEVNVLYPLAEIVLIIIGNVIIMPKFIYGLKGIFGYDPNIYSFSVYTSLFLILYDVILTVLLIKNESLFSEQKIMMFGFVASLMTVMALLADLLNCIRESNAFTLISSQQDLYSAETLNDGSENVPGKAKSFVNCSYVRKIHGVGRYFELTCENTGEYMGLIYIFFIVPIVSFIVGCVAGFSHSSLSVAVSVTFFTLFMGLPSSYIFYTAIPFFITSKKLNKHKSAVIGEASLLECAKIESMMFDDTDAVSIVSGLEMKPEDQTNINETIKLTSRIFLALGGPLAEIVKDESVEKLRDIIIRSVDDNGIELYVNSANHVLIGDKNYMASHDIRVKTDNRIMKSRYKDHVILYIAIDKIPKLGYIVGSTVIDRFKQCVHHLAENGIKSIVRTYDPEINEEYLRHHREDNAPYVSVYKPSEYIRRNDKYVCNGGIISASGIEGITESVIAGRRLVKSRKILNLMNTVLMFSGMAIATVISLIPQINSFVTGGIDARPMIILLFQAISIIMCIISGIKVSSIKDKPKEIKK